MIATSNIGRTRKVAENMRIVADLHAAGKLNAEIAQALGMSKGSVSVYLRRLGLKANLKAETYWKEKTLKECEICEFDDCRWNGEMYCPMQRKLMTGRADDVK